MNQTRKCDICQKEFEQELRRGRPYKFCEDCRKLLWYEKKKAREALNDVDSGS